VEISVLENYHSTPYLRVVNQGKQIMKFIQNNELFSELSQEEAANINGGGPKTAAAFITLGTTLGIDTETLAVPALLLATNTVPNTPGD